MIIDIDSEVVFRNLRNKGAIQGNYFKGRKMILGSRKTTFEQIGKHQSNSLYDRRTDGASISTISRS